ncbi:glycosyltransferase [Frigidibacter oleivorans]|uniref:glycosyltransferase n=1 Tax=Frigidibacter oleivorans TaxID=2487129 RepID=UPI001F277DF3|nr:glycosyltransferase [Frigidibacter oleivorans]
MTAEVLARAQAVAGPGDKALADLLLAEGAIAEPALTAALARQWALPQLDPRRDGARPDPRLIDAMGAATCLRHALLPWRQAGAVTLLAAARPSVFLTRRDEIEAALGPCALALAPEAQIRAALLDCRATRLARAAEAQAPAATSCRGSDPRRAAEAALLALLAAAIWLIVAPLTALALLAAAVLGLLVAVQALKLAALVAAIWPAPAFAPPEPPGPALARAEAARLPFVSVMVPMFREPDIAPRLLARLGQLDYPRHRLEVLLVIEACDHTTRAALAGAGLPGWMRVVSVPAGPVQTKPRALNYALNLCRGSVIGVWDAEDAPDPGQIRAVAARFATAPEDVVCLQGILDFYNPATNWLARMFTIEYAAWFRLFLPGLARLGLVVPLGGTTLFFRRRALEALGGWDAHNVTEDADLGLRIARAGLRTELIATVTREEANCRTIPWVKQRSRWQKGFLMTWAAHMRAPRALWRDLGGRRFLGLQVLLAGTVGQALFAPLLWSFWLIAAGLPHPLQAVLPPAGLRAMVALFLLAEAATLAAGAIATRGPAHRHLWPWMPLLHLYNMLGTLSAWKALREIVVKPFYWDKTQHGIYDADPAAVPEATLPRPAA